MSISANYPQPVQVNGFTCHNCTEVDEANKHIDPAHPKSGPYGINAANDPTQKKPIIQFGGSLSASQAANASSASGSSPASSVTGAPTTTAAATQPGQSLDIQA